MFKRQKKRTPVYERLMKRTKIPLDRSQCWEWTGPVNNAGYGMIKEDLDIENKMVTVHRVAAREKGLDITREINHTCLNKRCVNPDHLVYGSPRDRMDRILDKHGNYFHMPKNKYKTCEHCNGTTHYVWFNRRHDNCYPGMMNKYSKYLRKKV